MTLPWSPDNSSPLDNQDQWSEWSTPTAPRCWPPLDRPHWVSSCCDTAPLKHVPCSHYSGSHFLGQPRWFFFLFWKILQYDLQWQQQVEKNAHSTPMARCYFIYCCSCFLKRFLWKNYIQTFLTLMYPKPRSRYEHESPRGWKVSLNETVSKKEQTLIFVLIKETCQLFTPTTRQRREYKIVCVTLVMYMYATTAGGLHSIGA